MSEEWFCDDCFYISKTYSKFEDMNVCSDCGSENIIRRKPKFGDVRMIPKCDWCGKESSLDGDDLMTFYGLERICENCWYSL